MAREEQRPPGRLRRTLGRVRDGVARVDPETALLLLAAVATVTLVPIEASLGIGLYGVPVFAAFVFALAHAGCIPLAVRHPALAAFFSLASVAALQMLSEAPSEENWPWPWWPVLIVTTALTGVVIGFRGSTRTAVTFWISSIVVSSLVALTSPTYEANSVSIVVFAAVCGGVQLLAGVLAQWSDIREQLLTERRVSYEEYSRRMVAEDRARIARELHDVVAHSLSVITVQATTASFRHADLPPAAVTEFGEIAAASRQAMGEMRDLLGVLRAGPEVPQAPQPSIGDVPELVDQTRRSGADIDLDEWLTTGEEAEVSPVAGLAVYRIVQQALANALRHAPGARILVSARLRGTTLWVDVENDPPSRRPGAESSEGAGMGLISMSERAAGVGGSVDAGHTADGGFRVIAVVPVRATALADLERS